MSDLVEAAARLTARGWSVIALRQGQKEPVHRDWPAGTITHTDILQGCNLGVKLGAASNDLVDVDLDSAEAVHAAAALLPRTLTHGRPSRPDSHHWFYCKEFPFTAFKDVDGKMLLEVRGDRLYTMVPPSVHPSGEVLAWGGNPNILTIQPADLKLAVTRVAAVCLLARHWPSGGRHYAAGHVGGYLARLGEPAIAIRQMMTLICELARDEEAGDRVRFAVESAEKYAKGDHTTGGPTVAEHFSDGKAIVALLGKWYAREGESIVDLINKHHFVAQLGKGMVVGEEDEDGVSFQNFTDFSQRYCNQFVGKRPLGQFWLTHPARRTFRRARFAPPGSPIKLAEKDYNTWRGFSVQPSDSEEGCTRYLAHIQEVLCGGNTDHANFVLDLFADAVQRPGRLTGKALAVRGPQGVGKSVTFESFGRLFGPHYMAVSSRDQIVGAFNAHLSSKVVLFADEAIWGGRREDIGTLKSLVTQDRIVIQRKGIDRVEELNCLRLLMATNEDWVWPAGNQERRGVILDVTELRSPAYFDQLWAEVEDPAFGPALLGFLQRRAIDYPRLRKGFTTPALLEQQEYTADVVQQWWKTVLDEGVIGAEPVWPEVAAFDSLYELFVKDMGTGRGAGVVHRCTRGLFIKRLLRLLPPGAKIDVRKLAVNIATHGAPQYQHREVRALVLPNLSACRAEYNRVTGAEHVWLVPDVPKQNDLEYDL